MSDENPPAPAPPAPQPTPTSALPEEALTARLEREREAERRKIATEFGVDLSKVPDALKRLKELEDAQLSEKERADRELSEAKGKAAKADQYAKRIKEIAEVEYDALSDEHKSFVTGIAGEDPDARLLVITNLKKSGMLKAAPVLATPASTSRAEPPPKDEAPKAGSPDHHYAEWQKLPPLLRAPYFDSHASEIVKSKHYKK